MTLGKVYACVGRYAANPYTIKKACVNIYCVEELCYYIRNNAFFIDDDFINLDLFKWLEEECNLIDISKKLKNKAKQEKRIEKIVRCLFEEVGYLTEEEIDETENLLAANRGMPSRQKLKLRADYFLKNDMFAMALQTYEDLLLRLDNEKDAEFIAVVYYDIGVIYAKLFLFNDAAEYFNRAYELHALQDYLISMLAAYRMQLSEEAYLKKIASLGDVYSATSILENKIDDIKALLNKDDEYLKIKGIWQLKKEGNISEYNDAIEHQLMYYKESYRGQVEPS